MNSNEIKKIISNSEIKKVLNRGEVVWQGGLDLMSLPIGSKVVDPNTKYYGKPIVWLIADKNHAGYPSNSVTLISEKILCLKAYDAKEPNNPDKERQKNGNNRYKFSNILQWLNSDKVDWYTSQHGADAPPNSSNTSYNAYDNEPGFLCNFSLDFKNAMVSTAIKTLIPDADGGGIETVTSKIFLAAGTEVGLGSNSERIEGTKFPVFNSYGSGNAYPTTEAVSKSNYTDSKLNASSPWYYWFRTPHVSVSSTTRCAALSGVSSTFYSSYRSDIGVRPLCNVSSDAGFFEIVKE